jgi:hypothetical protein
MISGREPNTGQPRFARSAAGEPVGAPSTDRSFSPEGGQVGPLPPLLALNAGARSLRRAPDPLTSQPPADIQRPTAGRPGAPPSWPQRVVAAFVASLPLQVAILFWFYWAGLAYWLGFLGGAGGRSSITIDQAQDSAIRAAVIVAALAAARIWFTLAKNRRFRREAA